MLGALLTRPSNSTLIVRFPNEISPKRTHAQNPLKQKRSTVNINISDLTRVRVSNVPRRKLPRAPIIFWSRSLDDWRVAPETKQIIRVIAHTVVQRYCLDWSILHLLAIVPRNAFGRISNTIRSAAGSAKRPCIYYRSWGYRAKQCSLLSISTLSPGLCTAGEISRNLRVSDLLSVLTVCCPIPATKSRGHDLSLRVATKRVHWPRSKKIMVSREIVWRSCCRNSGRVMFFARYRSASMVFLSFFFSFFFYQQLIARNIRESQGGVLHFV